MKQKTKPIAFGGVLSGLAVVLMFLTGIFPFAEYNLPAMAGALLIVMVIEYGYRNALLCFFSVAVLSLLIGPNKEAAVLFAGFFGYYPILKGILEKLKQRQVEWLLKLSVFNAAVAISYFVIIRLFGITEVPEDFGAFGKWGTAAFWLAGNGVFILYDIVLTRFIGIYYSYFKPRFFKK